MKVKSICATLFISLFLSCNNGIEELQKQKDSILSISNLRQGFLDIFTSFSDMISDTFGITKDTTKQQVGEYFGKLSTKLGEAASELEKVAEKAAVDVDKDGLLNKSIIAAIDTAKKTLEILKGHLESLKDIGDSSQKIGEAATDQGKKPDEPELKKAYNALKGIVDTAKTQKVEEPKKSDVSISAAKLGGASPQDGAKVLTIDTHAGAAVGSGASTIVSAVSGKAILAAIVGSGADDPALAGGNAQASTSAVSFARGGSTATNIAKDTAKVEAVAGGIALRSLVKGGKLAANTGSEEDKASVQAAGIAAANKLLVAVEDIIKKTVKNVLRTVKSAIDKARETKEPASESSKK
ncbi:variable large family protein [Borrelia coriaceae]|uniref:variable large family protein n=1 Tax=Borrelia coriaceae TaxID=144 RepID=UPI003CCBD4DA